MPHHCHRAKMRLRRRRKRAVDSSLEDTAETTLKIGDVEVLLSKRKLGSGGQTAGVFLATLKKLPEKKVAVKALERSPMGFAVAEVRVLRWLNRYVKHPGMMGFVSSTIDTEETLLSPAQVRAHCVFCSS